MAELLQVFSFYVMFLNDNHIDEFNLAGTTTVAEITDGVIRRESLYSDSCGRMRGRVFCYPRSSQPDAADICCGF